MLSNWLVSGENNASSLTSDRCVLPTYIFDGAFDCACVETTPLHIEQIDGGNVVWNGGHDAVDF